MDSLESRALDAPGTRRPVEAITVNMLSGEHRSPASSNSTLPENFRCSSTALMLARAFAMRMRACGRAYIRSTYAFNCGKASSSCTKRQREAAEADALEKTGRIVEKSNDGVAANTASSSASSGGSPLLSTLLMRQQPVADRN